MPESKTRSIIRRGTRAAQPIASDVQEGSLYFVTDEGVIERSTGSAWESFSSGVTQYTDEMAQDAVGSILVDTPATGEINLVYIDATPEIYAQLKDGGTSLFKLQLISSQIILGRDSIGTGEVEQLSVLPTAIQDAITRVGGPLSIVSGVGTVRQINTLADTLALYLLGATVVNNGASLQFYGESHASFPGDVYMVSGGINASPNSIIELAYRDSGGYKGRFRITKNGKFGFPTGYGNGGTVTQLTNKATGVTLSTPTGNITMHNAALAADTVVSFVLTNTLIEANDYVLVQHVSAGTAGAYNCTALAAAGSATINVRNLTAGSLGEAIVLKFIVIKGTVN